MMRRLALAAVALLFSISAHAAGFSDWAAVVVSGDNHAHDGSLAEVFDNGRRDIASALVGIGFKPENIEQFSVDPSTHPGTNPSTQGEVSQELFGLTDRASGGCFAYFTSHGNGDGIVMGSKMLEPRALGLMVSNACGDDRPTVIIVSACFSGTFINQYAPQLQAPNRFVLTAARTDRTSFGCGNTDKYTFFDQCVLESVPLVGSFPDLARVVQQCVSRRESKEGVVYPSEPQVFVGDKILAQLPRWR